jgi:hypothetical protein
MCKSHLGMPHIVRRSICDVQAEGVKRLLSAVSIDFGGMHGDCS